MATVLRLTCPQCGDVDVPIDGGRLVISGTESGSDLQFDCPRCGAAGVERLDDRAASLLMAAGICMVASSLPQHPVGGTQTSG
jgi:predicted RNA-binding Zn-ribbon protein involved in translation (DUF1610 family)